MTWHPCCPAGTPTWAPAARLTVAGRPGPFLLVLCGARLVLPLGAGLSWSARPLHGAHGLLLPKPTRRGNCQASGRSLPAQTVRQSVLVSASNRAHCHPVSHPGHARRRQPDHLIRRVCHGSWRPGHMLPDLPGWLSLARVILLCCATLSGQNPASAAGSSQTTDLFLIRLDR